MRNGYNPINTVLVSNDGYRQPEAPLDDVADYLMKCEQLTGSSMMPAILYKGQRIEVGRLGTRRAG